jgi:flagellar biosynthesis chaperone FliJ
MKKPTDRKSSTINTIITSLTLQKNQLEGQIYQLQETIKKKEQTIKSFEAYLNEYKGTFYNTTVHRVPSYRNNQEFLDELSNVLYSEKKELNQLELKKMDLISRCHTFNQKIDGFNDILALHQKTCQIARDNIEDTNRTELATVRACQQNLKEYE